jgi:hypothetical protein
MLACCVASLVLQFQRCYCSGSDDSFGGGAEGDQLYKETAQSAKRRRKDHKDAHPVYAAFSFTVTSLVQLLA